MHEICSPSLRCKSYRLCLISQLSQPWVVECRSGRCPQLRVDPRLFQVAWELGLNVSESYQWIRHHRLTCTICWCCWLNCSACFRGHCTHYRQVLKKIQQRKQLRLEQSRKITGALTPVISLDFWIQYVKGNEFRPSEYVRPSNTLSLDSSI